MDNKDYKSLVLSKLRKGKAYPLKGQQLATLMGEKDTRKIRLAIQELIEDGYPIIGSAKPPYGYYIAENIQECQENLESLMSYIKMLARHHKFLQKATFKNFSGQTRMRLG